MSNYTVSLVGPAPWGFRLQGGKDFNMPLTISRLSDGGKAARANVGIGDVVFTIDGISADGMTHLEAQNKIKACTGNLTMTLQRVASTTKPEPVPVQKGELKEVVKPVPVASAVAPKVTSTVNVAYNKAPRPFGAITSSKVTSIPSPSSAFTPAHVTGPSSHASPPPLATVTPPPFAASGLHANAKSSTDQRSPALSAVKTAVNIPRQPTTHNTALNALSTGNVQDVTEGQRRGFKENQGDSKQQNGNLEDVKNPPKRPPRKHIVDTYTEFYHMPTHRDASKKRLIEDTEDWHPRTGTTQSRSFRILAQITGTDHMKEPEPDSTKKTKESQTENGDLSMSTDLPNGIGTQNTSLDASKHTVATQTFEMPPGSAVPSTPLPAMRSAFLPESASVTSPLAEPSPVSVLSPKLSEHVLVTLSPERKLLFDNPLEALPKGAPHPPAFVQIFNVSSEVATVSKMASFYAREITDSAESSAPYVANLLVEESEKESYVPDKCTVATQTSEPLLPAVVPVEQPFSIQSVEPRPLVPPLPDSFHTRKVLPENPLESLPKFAPSPAPFPSSTQSSKIKSSAAAAVSAAVAVRARLSNPNVYRSLLDALLITPISKPPPLQTVKPSRKSTSALELKSNKSDSLEATQPVAYAASVKNMPMSPDTKSSTANITSATAVKPTEPQSAVKYSGWQPSNQAAQGWTSNSIAPSGAAAASTKSLMQPQRTEQDTLIQRAEHIPAGKRTPMCAQCDQVIRGPFLVALGKSWHPEEFNCAHCKTSMAYIGFVEEKGALYCEVCYEKFFAPECSRCQRKILGEVINALKQTWHVSCFVCVACHNPIRNNVFHLEDGDPYCETDYYSLFGTMCHGCEFPIEAGDKFLEALGHTWHDTCFVCSVCCDSLEGQTFFSKKDKPLCKKHAHSVNF
ncbi:PDZ and LIM domain protein 5 isoform X5 [Alligator sinensis]|uniref:PDZ and LIM domain protein 5 isoform X5 n=1 Tax=Alligator sinensis TaxID=38654 RepID=A0A3Q0G6I9_ALLSI|nr:PDZ and LIM domain protein 5 isoform X5 [Alligator sinensis]